MSADMSGMLIGTMSTPGAVDSTEQVASSKISENATNGDTSWTMQTSGEDINTTGNVDAQVGAQVAAGIGSTGAVSSATGGSTVVGKPSQNAELNQVALIGAEKKDGYMNGLGGTSDPAGIYRDLGLEYDGPGGLCNIIG